MIGERNDGMTNGPVCRESLSCTIERKHTLLRTRERRPSSPPSTCGAEGAQDSDTVEDLVQLQARGPYMVP